MAYLNRIFFSLIASFALLCGAHLRAAPTDPAGDELSVFLADKGLIQRVGQRVSHQASELVIAAMSALGLPYRSGGTSFDSGFDCSGFVKILYEQSMGLLLPRKAEQQAAATQTIDPNELKPGDLVFFNTIRSAFSHVGIYVGDHKFIHSPKPGAEVRIEDMRQPYWSRRFDGARRVNPDNK
jgi:cell wall-associated NlpC family hydrolase